MPRKTSCRSIHSVRILNSLEAASAFTFNTPGKWRAVTHEPWVSRKDHSSKASRDRDGDRVLPSCSHRRRRFYCPFPEEYDVGDGDSDPGVVAACLLSWKPSKLEWLPWVPNNWCVALPLPRSSVPQSTFHFRLRPSPVRMHRSWW